MTLPPQIFITGTDTNVGKTIAALTLYEGLRLLGFKADYWKPVQTGDEQSDRDFLAAHTSYPEGLRASRHSYKTPRSPDQAAMLERRPAPTADVLLQEAEGLALETCTLIEGAGGVLVPLNEHGETWLTLLSMVTWPVIVVARPTLGTINHTSLTLDKLAASGRAVLAVIFSGEADACNHQSLVRRYPKQTFLHLPTIELKDRAQFRAAAKALAKDVLAAVAKTDANDLAVRSAAADAAHVWHPYTQHATTKPPLVVTNAQGVWLTTAEGERLFDATSSWWVNTIGHGRPEIAASIAAQQQQLDHVLFAGLTHAPAAELAAKMCDLAQGAFKRVFFTDNGSTAVEVALKMAYQSFTNRGETKRTKFLCLKGGYHGDTLGTMAVGGGDGFSDPYRPLLFKATHWTPKLSHPSRFDTEANAADPARFKAYLAEHHSEYAALIVEPLVQGAGGMLMHDAAWLKRICETARAAKIPVIFDEVFSGMGRCGAWFAHQRLGWVPDIVCIAKGLTGGTLPLALTLSSEAIYEHFLSDEKAHALLHGHSYTANAIACSAALATIGIYEREALCERSLVIEKTFKAWIRAEEKSLQLIAPRCLGAILALEIPGTGSGGYFHGIADSVSALARQHGLWLRPLGNTIYLVPPLSVTERELAFALDKFGAVIKALSCNNK